MTIAHQVEKAIEKNELIVSIKTEFNRTAVIESILREISSDVDLLKNLESILLKVMGNLKGDYGYMALLTKDSKYITPNVYYELNQKNLPILLN